MQPIDALICPRWTVRVEPEVRAEEGIALAVDGGRIVDVLTVTEAERRFVPAVRHDRSTHVLLPGLVNAHCHAAMSLLRGFADDVALEAWLRDRVWPAEQRWLSPEFVADGTRLAIAEMLAGGITCFSDMYYYPEAAAEVAAESGMRAVLGMIALDAPTAWAADADEYLRKGLELHDRLRLEPLLTTAFAPHSPYTVSDATLSRIRLLADELEVPIHTHVHETAVEVATAVAATGRRPLARLDALGLVTPALIGVHATQLSPAEIDLLANAGASVVHCPRSNLKLASGLCPVAALGAAGVNVALGTDGAASNNRLDLWAELQLAALVGKVAANDASAIPAAQALAMATINGARALGLADEIGSLLPGKAADMICVDLSGLEHQPLLDPLSQLVYAASRHDVTDVWVAGEHLIVQRQAVRMDLPAIGAAAQRWKQRLQGAAS
ncbi:MAG TPA: TRZ/ATZ family hydrolase [Gammaproteobacteria bacterium]|jgi:5-methylthioadenosine/S-adenosylhomocysteine deaminase|nr:TRZ/ATZ family hydrolase [Gammaproteobacteria bacterium]